ncbi:hypothetical protein QA612_12875 [Evansella sp. AB-P1]|uniref:hypothetical protein n=1 Tax=Evansella sp. AB-P1 TaxID=3037653 RepID=UPI00241C4444|nr:hypothetical protein [Evansella sp. AB-P1]MDG5788375.1 hypothetical protein [Evansella sp. AB-P1]
MSLGLLLMVALLAVVALASKGVFNKLKERKELAKPTIKTCKTCSDTIPIEYDKSLCPNCKAFLT